MEKFWEDTINWLLAVLYHGHLPEKESWCKQYTHEVNNMIEDIKHFHQDNIDAGLIVSNESMANFLVYTEREHIGNEHIVKECAVDELQLLMIAAQILDELN